MPRYRVAGGPARFGIGSLLVLSAAQYQARVASLDLVKKRERQVKGAKDESEFVVRPRAEVEFKVGEIVGLADLPKGMVERLEPLDPPQSETDKRAAAHAELRAAGDPGEGKPRLARSPFFGEKILLLAGVAGKGNTPAREPVVVAHDDVIARAIKDQNIAVEEWNAATDEARTSAIATTIETLKVEAAKPQKD